MKCAAAFAHIRDVDAEVAARPDDPRQFREHLLHGIMPRPIVGAQSADAGRVVGIRQVVSVGRVHEAEV
ncbi:MAG: hypothetical protein ACO3JL_03185, partial [Myxococcota bacterium]